MKILVNAVSAVAGGGLTFLLPLLEAFSRRRNAEFTLEVAAPPDLGIPEMPRTTIHRIPEARQGLATRLRWENTGLIDLVRKRNADLLFCIANISPIRNVPIPTVLQIQNVAPITPGICQRYYREEGLQHAMRCLLLRHLSRLSAQSATHVITPSDSAGSLMHRLVPGRKVTTIHYGRTPGFQPGHPRPAAAPKDSYLLWVSNFYLYKGLDCLIEAMRQSPDLPPVVLVGKPYDEKHHATMMQRIRSYKLEHRFLFHGPLDLSSLCAWYEHAAAFVSPSWCESFSTVLLEAMSCGCPIACIDTGPMPELCGPLGHYARRNDPASLAQAMRAALSHAGQPTFQEASRKHSEGFNWSEAIEHYSAVFRASR